MKKKPRRRNLKVAIVKHFGTQERLARESGIHGSAISRMVRNHKDPTMDQAKKLSQLLKTPQKRLFEAETSQS